jgi:hypothetical protein
MATASQVTPVIAASTTETETSYRDRIRAQAVGPISSTS